jgi:hypothetical protein
MRMTPRGKILVGIAGTIAAYVLFAPEEDPQATQPTRSSSRAPAAGTPRHAVMRGQGALRALYRLSHRVTDGTSASAIFASHSWYSPPPPAPPPPVVVPASVVAQVPTAPPLPFTFMGSYTPDGATPVFFLTRNDRVYDVHIGDTLEGTYTVDSFANGQLVLTYKPLKIQQQLSVGGTP